jgi:hypothetical protein
MKVVRGGQQLGVRPLVCGTWACQAGCRVNACGRQQATPKAGTRWRRRRPAQQLGARPAQKLSRHGGVAGSWNPAMSPGVGDGDDSSMQNAVQSRWPGSRAVLRLTVGEVPPGCHWGQQCC